MPIRSRPQRRPFAGRALAAGLLVLAACGSDDDDASSATTQAAPATTAPDTTAAPATTAAPVTTAASATFDAATVEAFQQALDDTRAQGGFPGVIAGVWSPTATWIGSSGTVGADETGAPTPADHTRVGSLTKTVTATVLLQLYQEGELSLNDPIDMYVPGMPNGNATLRQLADMTSGIPIYTLSPEFQDQLFADPAKNWTPEELLAFVRDMPPTFAPGAGWEYSNTNYVLLGLVIEQVTGKSITDVFQERIFGPLGMTQSTFPPGTTDIAAPNLFGLTEQGQPAGQTTDATHWNPSEAFTAGAIISTLDDLKTWADALFTGEGILDAETQQLRRDSIIHDIPPNTPTAGYGIGIGDRDGWWGHDGDIPGYTTEVFHNYDLETTVIVAVNSDIDLPSGAAPAPAVFAALTKVLPGAS